MGNFSYTEPAEFFASSSRARAMAGGRQPNIRYRRFNSGAEALRYVVEEIPGDVQARMVVESEEGRFDFAAVRAFYDSADYPLTRA